MATSIVTANTAPQTLFTTPTNMKAKPSEIDVDNQGASGPITVQLTDTFTPDPSVGQPSPTQQVITRFQATIAKGSSFSADELSCKDIEFLGVAKAVASSIDAGCAIIVGYHLD